MENSAPVPGYRQVNLKKTFNRSLRCLLTACSGEEFRQAFPSCTAAEQERLHRFFIQACKFCNNKNGFLNIALHLMVISSLHESIQEEFESLFLETQAGSILDRVEELVEEHTLDPLRSEKSNVGEAAQNLSEAKKNELIYLTGLVEKAKEQNSKMKERLELLKKEKQDFSGAANFVHELSSTIANYESGYHTKLVNL